MNALDVTLSLQELIPQMQRAANPEEEMIKYASSRNLSSAQLERLSHAMNTAIAVGHFTKAAGDERGADLRILDVPSLLREYANPPIAGGVRKNAGTATATPPTQDYEFRLPDKNRAVFPEAVSTLLEKTAAAAPPRESVRDQLQKLAAHDQQLQQLHGAEFSATARRIDLTKQLAGVIRKNASAGPAAVNTMEREALTLVEGGPLVKLAFDLAEQELSRYGILLFRAKDNAPYSDWCPDTYGICKIASGLVEALALETVLSDVIQEQQDLRNGMATAATIIAKHAAAGTQRPPKADEDEGETMFPGGGAARVLGRLAGKNQAPADASESPATLQLLSSIRDMPGQAVDAVHENAPNDQSLLSNYLQIYGDSKDKRREAVSSALNDARQTTALQSLLVSDPVISKANPEDVLELFEVVREINPGLVRSPKGLAYALREMLQYGSVPAHMIESLSTTRQRQAQAVKDEQGARKDRLAISKPRTDLPSA